MASLYKPWYIWNQLLRQTNRLLWHIIAFSRSNQERKHIADVLALFIETMSASWCERWMRNTWRNERNMVYYSITIMQRIVLLDMRFLYHAWNMDRPRHWFGWMTRRTSRYYTQNTQRWNHLRGGGQYIRKEDIILAQKSWDHNNVTESGTKTIYSVTTRKLLTNRGDRSNPDSTMLTWNHSPSGCTRGPPNIKQGKIRAT